MALNWIRPIPAPPKAPASSPSSISVGIVSSRDFFFLNFAIHLLQSGSVQFKHSSSTAAPSAKQAFV
jgi:hypothetical protein